jgi:hypothetical protein
MRHDMLTRDRRKPTDCCMCIENLHWLSRSNEAKNCNNYRIWVSNDLMQIMIRSNLGGQSTFWLLQLFEFEGLRGLCVEKRFGC